MVRPWPYQPYQCLRPCLGTVQETGELDFSDFEKAGGGGVKKGIFTEATGEKHPRESDDIVRPSKWCRE